MVTNEVVNLTTFIVSYNKLSSSVILKGGGGDPGRLRQGWHKATAGRGIND